MARHAKNEKPEDPLAAEKKGAILALTDQFCKTHLNAEYKRLTRKLVERMAKENPPPFMRGKTEIWAAGIVHAIGGANYLFDNSFKPYISAADLAAAFGVSPNSSGQKATLLRDKYPIGFPHTEFATKNMAGMADDLMGSMMELLSQSGMMLGGDANGNIRVGMQEGGALFADEFRLTPRRPSRPGDAEFFDGERQALHDYYDLTETYEQSSASPALIKKLEAIIAADPDFYDSYIMLADILEENDKPGASEKAAALRDTAFRRALARITDKKGDWPKSIPWGYLENRHVVRALLNGGIAFWEAGDTNAALDIFRNLLRSNARDNIGVRNYILAVRLGQNLEQHEAQFETADGFLDARKMWEWFDKESAAFPDEFAEWKKQVEQDE